MGLAELFSGGRPQTAEAGRISPWGARNLATNHKFAVFWLCFLLATILFAGEVWAQESVNAQGQEMHVEQAIENLVVAGEKLFVTGDKVGAAAKWNEALGLCKKHNLRKRELYVEGLLVAVDYVNGKEERARTAESYLLEAVRKEGFKELEARILFVLGRAQLLIGRPEQAWKYFQVSLALARNLDDPATLILVRDSLATVEEALGKPEAAMSHLAENLEISRKQDSPIVEAAALSRLAGLYLGLGRTEEAEKAIGEALAIAEKLENNELRISTLIALANINNNKKKWGEAVGQLLRAAELCRETGNTMQEVYVLSLLAKAYAADSQADNAVATLRKGKDLAKGLGFSAAEGAILEAEAQVHEALKDFSAARDAWRSTLALVTALGPSTFVALANLGIARNSLSLGDYSAVVESGRVALATYQFLQKKEGMSEALRLLLSVLERDNQNAAVLAALTQSVETARRSGSRQQLAMLLEAVSTAHNTLGKTSEAVTAAAEAKGIYRTLDDKLGIVRAVCAESEALWNTGNQEEALSNLRAISGDVEQLNVPPDQARYFLLMAGSLSSSIPHEALTHAQKAMSLAVAAGEKTYEGLAFLHQSKIYGQLAMPAEAVKAAESAVSVFRTTGSVLLEAKAELALANALLKFESFTLAVTHYEKAYQLSKALGNPLLAGDVLSQWALALSIAGETEKALEYLRKEKELYESLDYPQGFAKNEFAFGSVLLSRKPAEALEHFQRAIEMSRRTNDYKLECAANQMAAQQAYELGEPEAARKYLAEARSTILQKGTPVDRLGLLLAEASLFQRLGDLKAGLSAASEARTLAAQNGLAEFEVQALDSTADFHRDTGDLRRALATRLEALEVLRQARLTAREASELSGIAALYAALGEGKKASEAAQEAVEVVRRRGDRSQELLMLMGIASTYRDRNEIEQALDLDMRVLELANTLGDRTYRSGAHTHISLDYFLLGAKEEAFRHAELAVAASEETGNLEYICLSLLAAGNRARDLKLYEQARKYLGRARDVCNRLQKAEYSVWVLQDYAHLLIEQQQFAEAERYLQDALAIAEKSGKLQVTLLCIRFLAVLAIQQKNNPKLLEFAERARLLAEKLGAPEDLYDAYGLLGAAHSGLGNYDKGYDLLKKADGFLDQTWTQSAKDTGPSRFFQDKTSLYVELLRAGFNLYVRSRYDLRYAGETFIFSEKARARNLAENFAKTAQAALSMNVPAAVVVDERRVQGAVQKAEQEYLKVLARAEAPAALVSQSREAYQQALAARLAFVESVRRQHPTYASLKYPSAVEVKDLPLRKEEILVEFFVTDQEVFRWIIKGGDAPYIKSFERLAISQKELQERVVDVLVLLQNYEFSKEVSSIPTRDLPPDVVPLPEASRRLFKILLGSAFEDSKDATHLIFVTHHVLGLIPFEVLVTGPSDITLGEQFDVSYAASGTFLALTRQAKKTGNGRPLSAYLVGDPNYQPEPPEQDAAVGANRGIVMALRKVEAARAAGYALAPLPGTRKEILRIAELLTQRGGTASIHVGEAATELGVKSARLEHFRYLHFATHAILANEIKYVREPALVLSLSEAEENDGFLTVSDILQLKTDAEMVVLSACSTAEGEYVEGEGTLALSRAFMYAGARSVVASLWKVSDEATASLMESFYRFVLNGEPKARALRLAKAELRKQGYDHPFFWAPFILWGE